MYVATIQYLNGTEQESLKKATKKSTFGSLCFLHTYDLKTMSRSSKTGMNESADPKRGYNYDIFETLRQRQC